MSVFKHNQKVSLLIGIEKTIYFDKLVEKELFLAFEKACMHDITSSVLTRQNRKKMVLNAVGLLQRWDQQHLAHDPLTIKNLRKGILSEDPESFLLNILCKGREVYKTKEHTVFWK